MSARPGVAEFTRVSELLPKPAFDVPEPERQALASDIQAQLASLPTTIPDIDTYRRVVESLPLLKKAEDKVVGFFKDMKQRAYEAHKAITTKEAEQLKSMPPILKAILGIINSDTVLALYEARVRIATDAFYHIVANHFKS